MGGELGRAVRYRWAGLGRRAGRPSRPAARGSRRGCATGHKASPATRTAPAALETLRLRHRVRRSPAAGRGPSRPWRHAASCATASSTGCGWSAASRSSELRAVREPRRRGCGARASSAGRLRELAWAWSQRPAVAQQLLQLARIFRGGTDRAQRVLDSGDEAGAVIAGSDQRRAAPWRCRPIRATPSPRRHRVHEINDSVSTPANSMLPAGARTVFQPIWGRFRRADGAPSGPPDTPRLRHLGPRAVEEHLHTDADAEHGATARQSHVDQARPSAARSPVIQAWKLPTPGTKRPSHAATIFSGPAVSSTRNRRVRAPARLKADIAAAVVRTTTRAS